MRNVICLLMFLCLLIAQPASAYVFGFSNGNQPNILVTSSGARLAEDTGWYRSGGTHLSEIGNYLVAQSGDVDAFTYRNYFLFNISTLIQPVTSASVRLFSYDVTSAETYTLYHVATDVHTVVNGPFVIDTFHDLRDGAVYGSRDYLPGEDNASHTINLNAAFLTDLNAAIGLGADRFLIGGAIDRPTPTPSVPEPSVWILFGLGLVGIAIWRQKYAILA